MTIRFPLLPHIVATISFFGCVLPCTADEFHDPTHGYRIEIPPNWARVPADALEQALSAVYGQDSPKEIAFDSAFQPDSPWPGIGYPYVLVRVVPLSEYGIHSQIDEDEFPRLIQMLTRMDPAELVEHLPDQAKASVGDLVFATPQLDRARRRYLWEWRIYINGIGPVHSCMAGYFGRDSVAQVIFYARDSEWSQYAAVRQTIIDSFQFDSNRAYNVSLANAKPPPAAIWSHVLERGMVGAMVAGVLSFVVGAAAKSGRKSRRISNTAALLIVTVALLAFGSPLIIAALR